MKLAYTIKGHRPEECRDQINQLYYAYVHCCDVVQQCMGGN